MSEDERLERLERRVEALERMVVSLAGRPGEVPAAAPPIAARPRPAPPAPPAAARPPKRPTSRLPDLTETWIGQRGLLAVGVFALLLAAGYLLKLSFDRNWIPPIMRCVGGVVAGAAVGAVGWRLQTRYRTYGAALIGAGAGIIYLSVWAASRLYGVLPTASGIVGLALVSVALAMIAYAIDAEALGTTAALGAFLAPLLLGQDRSNANLLLLYLSSMAAGLGLVAGRRQWRLAALVVGAGYFGIGIAGAADRAVPWAVLLYGVIGGTAGLYLGLRERWWETRLLTFSGGWVLVRAASERLEVQWPVLVAAVILSAPVWWHALRRPSVLPLHLGPRTDGPGWSLGELLYFVATPLLLGWALHSFAPERFDAHPGLVSLLVALPYLLAGYLRPLPAFACVGAAAAAIAASDHFDPVGKTWALLALALLWALLDHSRDRTDGRWYSVLTLLAALSALFGDAAPQRSAADPAFVGSWALALYGAITAAALLAAGLWRQTEKAEDAGLMRPALWVIAGAMMLFGLTGEIRRHFELRALSAETASLAAGLAVSAWWLVFAAALVGLGFRRSLKPARLAGLLVAGLAVAKVIFHDLSSLDALYRVGSVLLLALVTLSLAYLYYRHDRAGDAAPR